MNEAGKDLQRIDKIYHETFGGHPRTFARFSNSLSNHVYLVNGNLVFRLKEPSDARFYNTNVELKAYLNYQANGLTPHLYYFDKATGDMVTSYLKNTYYFLTPAINKSSIIWLARYVKFIHSIPMSLPPFRAPDRYETYKFLSKRCFRNDEDEIRVRQEAEPFFNDTKLVPCHNDLVKGNVLLRSHKKSLAFLDFEFAGANNPLFDIASIFSENGIRDDSLIYAFLEEYYGATYNDLLFHQTHLMMLYEDYLWYYWAMARFEATKNPAFIEVANEKLRNLRVYNFKTI